MNIGFMNLISNNDDVTNIERTYLFLMVNELQLVVVNHQLWTSVLMWKNYYSTVPFKRNQEIIFSNAWQACIKFFGL